MGTRRDVRQFILDLDWMGGFHGTAQSAEELWLVCNDLKYGGQAISRFARNVIYRPGAEEFLDEIRMVNVDGFEPTQGRLRHPGPAWDILPLEGDDDGYFELWRGDPRAVNRAFSRALTNRVFTLQEDDIAGTGAAQYVLGASPWPTELAVAWDILKVSQVTGTGTTAALSRWDVHGRRFYPEDDAGSRSIRFDPPFTGTVRVVWRQAQDDIEDDTTEFTPALEYVAWATLYEYYLALWTAAHLKGEAEEHYAGRMKQAYDAYWTYRLRELGDEYASEVIVREAPSGVRTAVPRMGRL